MKLSHQKGFTLIECILTLALMGMMAYTAVPLMGRSNTLMSLDAATKNIEADLRYTQNLATTTGTPHGFIATSNHEYQVYRRDGLNTEIINSPYDHQPLEVDLDEKYSNVTFGEAAYPNYIIEFDASGKPTTGGGTTLVLTIPDGDQKQITVTANSGNINAQ